MQQILYPHSSIIIAVSIVCMLVEIDSASVFCQVLVVILPLLVDVRNVWTRLCSNAADIAQVWKHA